jgi:hypothetical protein
LSNLPNESGQSPLPDVLTVESFGPVLAKEVERARRYYRGFGLMCVRLERPEPPAGGATWAAEAREAGKPRTAGGAIPARWLKSICRVVRRADLVARAPGGGVYILLPETPASGIAHVNRRLEEVLAQGDAFSEPARASLLISQAAYPRDGETPDELLDALREESR